MKRLLIAILTMILLLFGTVMTVAQVTCIGDDDYPNTDTWYFVEPKAPYLEVYYDTYSSYSNYGVELYKNDHTFIDVSGGEQLSDYIGIAGSYLFQPGFFIGASYTDYNNLVDISITQISPGFRFNLGEPGYIAFSLDYQSSPALEGIAGYDARMKFFIEDTLKISADFYYEKISDPGTLYSTLAVDFKPAKKLALGFDYSSWKDVSVYDLGFTWKPSILIIDGQWGKNVFDHTYVNVSGMCKLGKIFKIGAQYKKLETTPDGLIQLKAALQANQSKFVFKYTLPNDTYPDSEFTAAFEMSL